MFISFFCCFSHEQKKLYPTNINTLTQIIPQNMLGSNIMIIIPIAMKNNANPTTFRIDVSPIHTFNISYALKTILCLSSFIQNLYYIFFCKFLFFSGFETIYHFWNQVQNLCHCILILDIY